MLRAAIRPVPAILRAVALALGFAALFPIAALAERADRDQPVNIESDRMAADDVKKTATFEGNVVLTQGTMAIRAERIVVRQDKDGFQSGSAIGGSARPLATFRQKREGINEYIEAEAERVEYDSKADRVEFFKKARLRRGGGDDVCGDYISYDSRTEFFSVNSGRGPAAPGAGAPGTRVRAVIMPRTGAAPVEPGPGAKPAAPCAN